MQTTMYQNFFWCFFKGKKDSALFAGGLNPALVKLLQDFFLLFAAINLVSALNRLKID